MVETICYMLMQRIIIIKLLLLKFVHNVTEADDNNGFSILNRSKYFLPIRSRVL